MMFYSGHRRPASGASRRRARSIKAGRRHFVAGASGASERLPASKILRMRMLVAVGRHARGCVGEGSSRQTRQPGRGDDRKCSRRDRRIDPTSSRTRIRSRSGVRRMLGPRSAGALSETRWPGDSVGPGPRSANRILKPVATSRHTNPRAPRRARDWASSMHLGPDPEQVIGRKTGARTSRPSVLLTGGSNVGAGNVSEPVAEFSRSDRRVCAR